MSDSEEFGTGILGIISEDFLPVPEQKNLGNSNLTFNGLLDEPGLLVYEDGGATGCGGKLWPAGELLSRYMIHAAKKLHGDQDDSSADNGTNYDYSDLINNKMRNVVELGSGTGLVGLAIALYERQQYEKKIAAGEKVEQKKMNIWVTDQENMVPLMDKNILLNKLEDTVYADILDWGTPLPEFANPDPSLPDYESRKVDVVLAADCVYLEAAFPLLEKTLLDLTEPKYKGDEGPLVLMAYKKRRKADARFFKHMRKSFVFEEIKEYPEFETFRKDSVYLYKIIRKKTDMKVDN